MWHSADRGRGRGRSGPSRRDAMAWPGGEHRGNPLNLLTGGRLTLAGPARTLARVSVRAPWVGREAELAALERASPAWPRRGRRRGSSPGSPGSASRGCWRRSASRAVAARAQVFEGRAAELERDFPFGVFVDALDPYLASLARRRPWPGLSAEQRRLLGLVFRSAGRRRERVARSWPRSAFAATAPWRTCCEVLAARRPLVLILDDLQWADARRSSCSITCCAARPPPPCCCCSPIGPASRPRRCGRSSSGSSSDRWIPPRRTRSSATSWMAPRGPRLRGERRQPVLPRAPGAGRAQRGGRERGGSLEADKLDVDVPPAVRAALARELAEAGEPTRLVLQGAAVAGDPFTPELAGGGRRRRPRRCPRCARPGDRRRVRRRGPRRRSWFRFRHPIVRRAVYASAGQGWRVGAHARAAAASPPADPARSPARTTSSARPCAGDEGAVADLRAAGEAVAVVAPPSAAGGSRPRCGCCPRAPRTAGVWSCSARWRRRSGAPGAWRRAERRWWRSWMRCPTELVAARVRLDRVHGADRPAPGAGGTPREAARADIASRVGDERRGRCRRARVRARSGPLLRRRLDRDARATPSAVWRSPAGEGGAGLRASAASLLGSPSTASVTWRRRGPAGRQRSTLLDAPDADARGLRLDALDWLGLAGGEHRGVRRCAGALHPRARRSAAAAARATCWRR